ncbi:chemotaxis protein CheX [Alkaliphilus peptidifermentans]|uniref:Chemotaxis protein CheX n=1 Tax=Alkaliphilus peptidifermentans DSM 18978 TaxID=1120976 RepID=A0A1G5K2R3_9FIRM|nr:chemotaxis protein CheX [Alkaliphilus peptidifermentans]SCY94308.1 chemotaxis protein CheX [Alkaliphilus peptidifermentans DSM 18978]
MKAELINSFLKAGQDVVMQMTGIKLEIEKTYIKKPPFDKNDIAIVIGVTGELNGLTAINMSEDLALKMASTMMGGMQISSLDEISKSAVTELGNMILGNAASLLYNEGVKVDITPPQLLENEVINYSKNTPIISTLLKGNIGTIEVEVAVKTL